MHVCKSKAGQVCPLQQLVGGEGRKYLWMRAAGFHHCEDRRHRGL